MAIAINGATWSNTWFVDSSQSNRRYAGDYEFSEEKWSGRLDRIEKHAQLGDVQRQEITDLTRQFPAIVESAQIDLVAAALARLKGMIHWEANRLSRRPNK